MSRKLWAGFWWLAVGVCAAASLVYLCIVLGSAMPGLALTPGKELTALLAELGLLALFARASQWMLFESEQSRFMLGLPATPQQVVRTLTTAGTDDILILAAIFTHLTIGILLGALPSTALASWHALVAVITAALTAWMLCHAGAVFAVVVGPLPRWLSSPAITGMIGLGVAAVGVSAAAVHVTWIDDLIASGAARWALDHSPVHALWAAFAGVVTGSSAPIAWGLVAAALIGLPLLLRLLAPWRVRRMRLAAEPPSASRSARGRVGQELPPVGRARRWWLQHDVRLEGLAGRWLRCALWLFAGVLAATALWSSPWLAARPPVQLALAVWAGIAWFVVLLRFDEDVLGAPPDPTQLFTNLRHRWADGQRQGLSSLLPIPHAQASLAMGVDTVLRFALIVLSLAPVAAAHVALYGSWAALFLWIAGAAATPAMGLLGVFTGVTFALTPIHNGYLRALDFRIRFLVRLLPVFATLAVVRLCAPLGLDVWLGIFMTMLVLFTGLGLLVLLLRDRVRGLDVDLPRSRGAVSR
jgi:hypothetical protein